MSEQEVVWSQKNVMLTVGKHLGRLGGVVLRTLPAKMLPYGQHDEHIFPRSPKLARQLEALVEGNNGRLIVLTANNKLDIDLA